MLILLGDDLRRHLAAAVAEHVRRLRRDGLAVPAELTRLTAAISASGGPERPTLDDASSRVDSAGMQPLTVDYRDAAEVLGVSERSVRRAVRAGDLPAVRVAGSVRIRTADLTGYVEGLAPTNSPTEEIS